MTDNRLSPDIVDQLQEAHDSLLGPSYDRSVFLTAMGEIQQLRTSHPPTIDTVPSCGQENDYRRATHTGGDDPAPFYGAQCPSYPACSGGCGLGCTHEIAQRERMPIYPVGDDQLSKLWNAIIENTQGDGFWIGEILLDVLEKETGFNRASLVPPFLRR